MKKRREGFTLISVLISVVLLSVGIMALANSMLWVTKRTRLETQKQQALELATQYMEELRGRDPWTLASEALANVDSLGVVNSNGTFTRQTTVTDEGAQLLRVVISVTPRNAPALNLTTLIFKVIV